VLETDVPLDSTLAGLPFPPRNGSFYLVVADDATGTPVAYRIDVDADGTAAGTTLDSLVNAINTQAQGVTASITSDRRLQVTAADGFNFTFGHDGQVAREDTSGVLAALGINTFFTGTDARNIAVSGAIASHPELLAASSVNLAGDGLTAGRIAALDTTPIARLRNASVSGFYQTVANAAAVSSAAARSDNEAASTVLFSLQAQRENISGVNLDEEAISLVKYQRAFQGAARFVSVVDQLLAELTTILR
jgi:flagellar hook-associated protein 1 FlgK